MKPVLAMCCALAVLCTISSCASGPGSKAPDDLSAWKGTTAYTQVNLWPLRGTMLHWVNYHAGAMLPINTAVTVKVISREKLQIVVSETGQKMTFANRQDRSNLDAYGWAARHLAPTPRDLSGFTPDEQDAIQKGKVKEGMSREAVLAAYGYPPAHRTPSLEDDAWTYWINKFKTRIVTFGVDDTVQEVQG